VGGGEATEDRTIRGSLLGLLGMGSRSRLGGGPKRGELSFLSTGKNVTVIKTGRNLRRGREGQIKKGNFGNSEDRKSCTPSVETGEKN